MLLNDVKRCYQYDRYARALLISLSPAAITRNFTEPQMHDCWKQNRVAKRLQIGGSIWTNHATFQRDPSGTCLAKQSTFILETTACAAKRFSLVACIATLRHVHVVASNYLISRFTIGDEITDNAQHSYSNTIFIIIIIFHTVQDTFSVYYVPGSTPVPQNPMNAMVMVMD